MYFKGIWLAVATFFIITLSQEQPNQGLVSQEYAVDCTFRSKSPTYRASNGENCPQRAPMRSQLWNSRKHYNQLNHFQRSYRNRNKVVPQGNNRRGQNLKTSIWPWQTAKSSLYGQWSKWSACSRTCITERHRRCLYSNVCGQNYQRDIAYCYTDGSSCDGWVRRQIFQMKKSESKGIVENKRVKDNNLLRNSNKTKIRQCGVSANIRFVVPNLKIVGGRPAARGRWPWQVAIFNEKQDVYCGGTLIAPKWVLTAAHCFRTTMYVRIGEHDLNHYEGTETDIKVSKVVVHPSYNRKTVDADIALLLLSRSVGAESKGSQTSVLGIACLPHHRQQVPVKQLCVTTGWGKSDFDDLHGTDVLHEVQVSILSSEMCQNVHLHYLITDNMFCAGNKRRPADSCTGDSGGPLLCKNRQGRWTVFGITSFGDGCGTRGKFGIYVKVAKFAKWIHSIMSRYG